MEREARFTRNTKPEAEKLAELKRTRQALAKRPRGTAKTNMYAALTMKATILALELRRLRG
ncbi:hypothetical protein MM326_13775 [Alkalihalobacillus sp. LMS6]|uniref:hypothetical protein n=1 Tax=Alkalihalobacillus sp. LMS6 TaxID=2924034 RepID=UPI0020D001D3|nr:hypothetical protein [Alkalihalobacillus sp. LMS6]UTR08604.1 hypothetical protein MM326_13775 [Alkalihalobacillus sp. LMS6]